MKTRFDVAIAFTLLTMSMASASLASGVVEKPLRFVDEDGVEIESYCVAPLYAKYSGVAWLGEGRKSDGKYYLMWPLVVKEGDGGVYNNLKTKSPSIQLGLIEAGESIGKSTILLLKAGRAPFVVDFWVDHWKTKTVVFKSGDSNAVIDLLTSDNVDQDAIRSLYKVPNHKPIVNNYTKEEKEMLRTCYKK